MSSTPKIRIQTIKGVPYVYEDHHYWDKAKQQIRHKRQYVGKMDSNGELIPNKYYLSRQDSFKQQAALVSDPQQDSERLFAGNNILLQHMANECGLLQDLERCFPEDYKKILAVAYYLVSENGSPLYRFDKWSRTHEHPAKSDLSSRRISELFASVSESAKLDFFKLQSKRRLESEYLAYDITSISSYSELISQVKYGHNKDYDPLPQVNLALVFGEKSMLPVYYRKLPGNIIDVKTVNKLLKDIDFLDLAKVKLVMDRGFYSADNINNLYKHHHKFLISARRNIKFVSELIDSAQASIKDYSNYCIDQDVYCTSSTQKWQYEEKDKQGNITIELQKRLYVHIYYNGQRAEDEKARFIKSLSNVEQAIKADIANDNQILLANKYFNIRTTPKRGLKIEHNQEAIDVHVNKMGYFVLLSNDIKCPKIALYIYKNKDLAEKAFSNLKNRLNMRRTSVSSSENLEGKLFVQFAALILVSCIHKCMKEHSLYRNYSIQALLDEIDVIEKFCYPNQRSHLGEITTKQRDILKCFGIDLSNMR